MKYSVSTLKGLVLVLLLSAGTGGCAVWDFVEVRYQNATGYFNTYYNAQSLYDEALEEIDELTAPQIEATPSQANAPQNFGQSIGMSQVGRRVPAGDFSPAATDMAATDAVSMPNPKGAEFGQEYGSGDGDSGFDGSGGMYGMGGTGITRAQQMANRRRMAKEFGMSSSVVSKLDRVIEKCSRLLVHYPKSKWVDNSLLMIGVSFYYKSDLIKAERKFKELLEGFPETDLKAEATMWLARVYDRLDMLDEAETLYLDAIELAISNEDADVVADAYYSLGEMYLTTGREEKALQAYSEGAQYASSKSNRIRLELALAREHEYMGNLDKAQKAYANIIKLDPEMELLFKAELNYARISRVRGDIDEAINTLADMLDEPAYLEYDGPLQLEIGKLYEAADEHEAAIEQYRYVDTTFQKTPVSSQACYALAQLYDNKFGDYDKAYEYYVKAKIAYPGIQEAQYASFRAEAFEPYFKVRNGLHDLDTLLFYVLHPDSLAARDKQQAVRDSLEREKKIAEGWDPNEKTEEQRMMERLARRRPHGRNTGKVNVWQQELDKLTGKTTTSPTIAGVPMSVNGGGAQAAPPKAGLPLYRRLDLRTTSADSVLEALSIQRFEMGWVMFDDIGNLDSAIYYYQFAIEGDIPDTLEAQAYYTLSEIYRLQKNQDMVNHYEDLLIQKHSRSRYARPVLLARGMDLPKDSATVAREAYERAAKLLERGSYQDGIKALRQMAENYSYSEQAVRAQLAIAMTYETALQDGEKALGVYREMLEKYPNSPYSNRAREILEAIERAKNEPPKEEKLPAEEVKTREVPQPTPPKPQLTPEERFQMMRDSVLSGQKKLKDPSEDKDFPLAIPGEEKEVNTPPAPGNTPPSSVPGAQQQGTQGQPGSSVPQGTQLQPGTPIPGAKPQPAGKDTTQQTTNPPIPTDPGTKPQ